MSTTDALTIVARQILVPYLELLGYRVIDRGEKLLVMQSDRVEVRIFQGKRSAIVGFEIAQDGLRFTLDDLLAASRTKNPGMAAESLDEFTKRFAWLRDFLNAKYERLLMGSEEEFDRLATAAERHGESYNYQKAIAPQVAVAREAFRRCDYEKVVSILEPIADRLYLIDRKKLKMAKDLTLSS